MSIQLSSYARLLEQDALLQEYAAECSIPEIGQAKPEARIYEAMEKLGVLQCFAAYHVEHMVGFASLLMPVMPHYSKRVATVESIFVTQSARKLGIGLNLMDAIESHAKERGCVAILYSAPTGGQFERVLDASKRYRRTNSVFCGSL